MCKIVQRDAKTPINACKMKTIQNTDMQIDSKSVFKKKKKDNNETQSNQEEMRSNHKETQNNYIETKPQKETKRPQKKWKRHQWNTKQPVRDAA